MKDLVRKIVFFSLLLIAMIGSFLYSPRIKLAHTEETFIVRLFVAIGLTLVMFGLYEMIFDIKW